MELIQYDNPFERTQRLIQDYARALYGIENASAITVLCEIAFDIKANPAHRLTAAKELVGYEIPKVKPIELVQPKNGPDFIINMQGAYKLNAQQEDELNAQVVNYETVIDADAEVLGADGNAKLAVPDATIDDDQRSEWE